MQFLKDASPYALCFAMGIFATQGYNTFINPSQQAALRPEAAKHIATSTVMQAIPSSVELRSGPVISGKVVDIEIAGSRGQALVTETNQVWIGPAYTAQHPFIIDQGIQETITNPKVQPPTATTNMQNVDLERERERFLEYASKAAAVTITQGDNQVYVFFDSDCTYCHQLFRELHSDGLAKENGLQVSWIPISIFKSERSKLGATTLAKKIAEAPNEAVEAFASLMTGKEFELDRSSAQTHQKTVEFNTALFLSGVAGVPGGGSPLVVFRDKSNQVKFFAHKPDKEVFKTVGPT